MFNFYRIVQLSITDENWLTLSSHDIAWSLTLININNDTFFDAFNDQWHFSGIGTDFLIELNIYASRDSHEIQDIDFFSSNISGFKITEIFLSIFFFAFSVRDPKWKFPFVFVINWRIYDYRWSFRNSSINCECFGSLMKLFVLFKFCTSKFESM